MESVSRLHLETFNLSCMFFALEQIAMISPCLVYEGAESNFRAEIAYFDLSTTGPIENGDIS